MFLTNKRTQENASKALESKNVKAESNDVFLPG